MLSAVRQPVAEDWQSAAAAVSAAESHHTWAHLNLRPNDKAADSVTVKRFIVSVNSASLFFPLEEYLISAKTHLNIYLTALTVNVAITINITIVLITHSEWMEMFPLTSLVSNKGSSGRQQNSDWSFSAAIYSLHTHTQKNLLKWKILLRASHS